MDIQTQQFLAAQLRKPKDEQGIEIAKQMNKGNAIINRLTIDKLKVADNYKILELGMGNGFFLGELLERAAGRLSPR